MAWLDVQAQARTKQLALQGRESHLTLLQKLQRAANLWQTHEFTAGEKAMLAPGFFQLAMLRSAGAGNIITKAGPLALTMESALAGGAHGSKKKKALKRRPKARRLRRKASYAYASRRRRSKASRRHTSRRRRVSR